QCIEHGEPSLIAVDVLRPLHAAERDPRLTAGVVGRHAGADVVVDVKLEMAAEFGVDVSIAADADDRRKQSDEPAGEASHEAAGPRKPARMSVVSSHWRASRSSCRRPALVSR